MEYESPEDLIARAERLLEDHIQADAIREQRWKKY